MKGLNVASHGSSEARHRSAGSDEEAGKRKSKEFVFREAKCKILFSGKGSSSCKVESLKLGLFIITCCTVLSLAFSPIMHREQQPSSHSSSRSLFVDVARMWQATHSDPRYASHLDVDWAQIRTFLKDLDATEADLKVGLLNFNSTDVESWRGALPEAEFTSVLLDYAETSITWKSLYPDWIDEEQEHEAPSCPSLPQPQLMVGSKFDLVAAKLPCHRSGSWSRDVARLHLQLAAAKAAADSTASYVLLVTDCLPIPNLFTCRSLAKRESNLWLYKPDPSSLQEKLQLPIGSCELAIPFEAKERLYTEFGLRREAYVTILHSAEKYVCGAIAAAKSIRLAGSARDLVILVDESIGEDYRSGLQAAGWTVRTIQRIRNPKAKRDAYNEWNYSKFRLWQLTDYDKIVFVDADLLVLRNIDFLFTLPEVSAISNNALLFNSGVMVIEPSNCTFQLLMDHIGEITSYNGGDQGYLNEIFTWWHRLPKHTNFLKHFSPGEPESKRARKESMFAAEPPAIYVAHYLGMKPWRCFRDYDCNWDVKNFWRFASDAAHARWWGVHDALPERLRQFCLLPTKVKAYLEHNRWQAAKSGFAGGHWQRNITDGRLGICNEAFCNWESMLLHWGETNSPSGANSSVNLTAATNLIS